MEMVPVRSSRKLVVATPPALFSQMTSLYIVESKNMKGRCAYDAEFSASLPYHRVTALSCSKPMICINKLVVATPTFFSQNGLKIYGKQGHEVDMLILTTAYSFRIL